MLRYVWHDGFRSVQMSPDVSLPQFVVIGHRQREIEEIEMMVSVLANQKAVLRLKVGQSETALKTSLSSLASGLTEFG